MADYLASIIFFYQVNWPTDNLYELQGSKCASVWWDNIVSCPLDYILIETWNVVCSLKTWAHTSYIVYRK